MKLRLKEDPREWRKSVLLAALGLALLSSMLRWRGVLPKTGWLVLLALLLVMAVLACLQPRWFRGYYRLSMRVGVALSQVVAHVLLAIIFFAVLTPLGFFLRLSGKDLLGLKRRKDLNTYWTATRPSGPLDRMF